MEGQDRILRYGPAQGEEPHTFEAFAATLTILGRHLAERQNVLEAGEYDSRDDVERQAEAVEALRRALDALDEAIGVLS